MVDNFKNWNNHDGGFSHSGNCTTVTTTNEGNLGNSFTKARGVLSTINIENVQGESAAVGMGMYSGLLEGYKVHVNIAVQHWSDKQQIYYYVRLRNNENKFVKVLATGYFGEKKDLLNTDLTIGFKFVDNEIWFYAEGFSVIKWSPATKIESCSTDSVWLWGWTDSKTGGAITAKFSNVTIIQCGTNDCGNQYSKGYSDGYKIGFSDGQALCSPPIAATLVSPNGTTSNPVTYTWNAVKNSEWYYLWVEDSEGAKVQYWYTAKQAGCGDGTGTCSIQPPKVTLKTGDCSWWIQTWNKSGYGPWSKDQSFNIQ